MNQQDFDTQTSALFDQCKDLLGVKGGEYTNHVDRLANFKRGAAAMNLDPRQVLFVYMSKHYDSIATHIRKAAAGETYVVSEPISGRIADLINYCALLNALEIDVGGPVLPTASDPLCQRRWNNSGSFE